MASLTESFIVPLQIKWLWVRVTLQSLKLQISRLFWTRSLHSGNYRYIQATIECRFTRKHVRDMIRTNSQMYRADKYPQHSWNIWPVWLNGWVFVYELSGCGCKCCCRHLSSDFATDSSKEFLDIQVTIEFVLTLKRVPDMIRTYSQMHRADKNSQHSSIIWSARLNGWVFVYKLSRWQIKSCCSHLNFIFCVCFEKGVSWNSGHYRVWIHSETLRSHDKKIQSNVPYR